MTFQNIPAGASVFLDANTLLYYFGPHPTLGSACADLIRRVENRDVVGYTSAHVLNEVVHRLMGMEASALFGWPSQGLAHRMRRHPADVQQLNHYRVAIQEIPLIGLVVLPVTWDHVSHAIDESRRFGLLASDALIVAVMRAAGLTNLASHDADFDRVSGITRYAPA